MFSHARPDELACEYRNDADVQNICKGSNEMVRFNGGEPAGRRLSTPSTLKTLGSGFLALIGIGVLIFGYVVYTQFRIDVPAEHIAVLTLKVGEDLENHMEIAPNKNYKGLQLDVLQEGRYFYNPYFYAWEVYPMVQIPENKLGVRVRLYGEDLPYGHFVATQDDQKGIVKEVLRPGRYPLNALVKDSADGKILNPRPYSDYVEIIELRDPVTIPAGFKGVVTNLAGPIPEEPNTLLVKEGFRGVQEDTLNAGTYYMNPYMYRIQAIDTRSQRFNLAENFDMGFPSKDGFWISLDGRIEFAVKPEAAAKVYVTYNEAKNDEGVQQGIDEEIIRKIIMPNARSFCRLHGSNSSGRDFIGGETRSAFEKAFQKAIRETCEAQGIEIVQAVITQITPPNAIAKPVRDREVARQTLKRYQQEELQQVEEAVLAKETALILQGQRMVAAEVEVIEMTTESMKKQEVALEEANRDREVAEKRLMAAKDVAAATLAQKSAEASVVQFTNVADAAGWQRSIASLGGSGESFAQYTLFQKLAPSYRSITMNTADSPLMQIFEGFSKAPADETLARPSEMVPIDFSTPQNPSMSPELKTVPPTVTQTEIQNDTDAAKIETNDPISEPEVDSRKDTISDIDQPQ